MVSTSAPSPTVVYRQLIRTANAKRGRTAVGPLSVVQRCGLSEVCVPRRGAMVRILSRRKAVSTHSDCGPSHAEPRRNQQCRDDGHPKTEDRQGRKNGPHKRRQDDRAHHRNIDGPGTHRHPSDLRKQDMQAKPDCVSVRRRPPS